MGAPCPPGTPPCPLRLVQVCRISLPLSAGVPPGDLVGVIPPEAVRSGLPQTLITLPQLGAQDRSGLREIYCSDKAILSPA